jgi:hypothetical protein
MKYFLFALLNLSFLGTAKADQLQWITKKQAKKARKVLKKQKFVHLYCGCCSGDVSRKIELNSVSIQPVEDESFYEVYIQYEGNDESVDLAYIWIEYKGKLITVGEKLKLEHDPCERAYYLNMGEPPAIEEATARSDAKDFALEVIQIYFDEDCKALNKLMSKSLYLMDGDGIVSKKDLKERSCESVQKAITDKSKTIDDYIDAYEQFLFTPQEIEEKFGEKLPDYIEVSESDFIFIGGVLKDEKSERFIWDDMFSFMIGKDGNRWVIKGISG